MKKGKLIVISGPSGVGKDTIVNKILDNKNMCKSISMTTRLPRDGEEDGINYYFVSLQEFLDNINKNNFLEYAEVYKNTYYGTPKDKVIKELNKGKNIILVIDVEGGLNIKKAYHDALLIFVAPPSIHELKNRLESRGLDTEKVILERLNKAKWELQEGIKYDYQVINDDIDNCVNEVLSIINKE